MRIPCPPEAELLTAGGRYAPCSLRDVGFDWGRGADSGIIERGWELRFLHAKRIERIEQRRFES